MGSHQRPFQEPENGLHPSSAAVSAVPLGKSLLPSEPVCSPAACELSPLSVGRGERRGTVLTEWGSPGGNRGSERLSTLLHRGGLQGGRFCTPLGRRRGCR